MTKISSIINKIVKSWCLDVKYSSKINSEQDYKKKRKYCEKCELLNEKISKLVSKIDEVFNIKKSNTGSGG
jgi:hypothetical protein